MALERQGALLPEAGRWRAAGLTEEDGRRRSIAARFPGPRVTGLAQRATRVVALLLGAAVVALVQLDAPPMLAAVVALVALGVTLRLRGRSPVALVAALAMLVASWRATAVDLLNVSPPWPAFSFFACVAGYGALLLAHRRARWGRIALRAWVVALVLAGFPVLDALGVTDARVAAAALVALLLVAAAGAWRATRSRAVYPPPAASAADGDASPDPARIA